jgi:CheY-like chemotaxis protein
MIVEDQKMVLGAIAALLGMEDDIEVVATAADGLQALEALSGHRSMSSSPISKCRTWAGWTWPKPCASGMKPPQ